MNDHKFSLREGIEALLSADRVNDDLSSYCREKTVSKDGTPKWDWAPASTAMPAAIHRFSQDYATDTVGNTLVDKITVEDSAVTDPQQFAGPFAGFEARAGAAFFSTIAFYTTASILGGPIALVTATLPWLIFAGLNHSLNTGKALAQSLSTQMADTRDWLRGLTNEHQAAMRNFSAGIDGVTGNGTIKERCLALAQSQSLWSASNASAAAIDSVSADLVNAVENRQPTENFTRRAEAVIGVTALIIVTLVAARAMAPAGANISPWPLIQGTMVLAGMAFFGKVHRQRTAQRNAQTVHALKQLLFRGKALTTKALTSFDPDLPRSEKRAQRPVGQTYWAEQMLENDPLPMISQAFIALATSSLEAPEKTPVVPKRHTMQHSIACDANRIRLSSAPISNIERMEKRLPREVWQP